MAVPRGRRYRELRARILSYGPSCAYCPAPATTVDHIVPVKFGGLDIMENLAPCCRRCNMNKGAKLDWTPITPPECEGGNW